MNCKEGYLLRILILLRCVEPQPLEINMTYLLRLDCSPRNRDSVSRELADNAEKRLLTLIPSLSTKTRDLATENLPHITNDTIAGFYAPPSGKTEKLKAATALSDELIQELKMADTLLISAPMYNFGVPSSLKAWIDQIVRINKTFAFDGSQFEGLVAVKRSVLVLSYGAQGYAQGGDLSEMDFLEPYLRALMSFLGIEKTHVIRIEGTTGDPDALETAKRQALVDISQLVVEES